MTAVENISANNVANNQERLISQPRHVNLTRPQALVYQFFGHMKQIKLVLFDEKGLCIQFKEKYPSVKH